ncbi:hypothetical protein AAG570_000774 [Ranatra chinensis]|uniref:Uncharacterized protein n=1 Tax=Ranatra chinensis TaxID=642074 RepID=A0ABD0YY15_9HEMI
MAMSWTNASAESNERREWLFDSSAERYTKLKDSTNRLITLQIGISCFKFVRDWNEYSCRVYRFYIFPRCFGTFDERILFQSSSCEFLANYNFDFNKVIYEGISYLNRTQLEGLRKQLVEGSLASQLETFFSHDHENWFNSVRSEVALWVTKCKPGDTYIVTSHINSFTYLLHKEIRDRFKQVWTYFDEKGVLIKAVTNKEREELSQSECFASLEEEILDRQLGFTKVFNLLVSLKKPIVGHNLLLDLMIMYNQFYNPLPSSLKLFKRHLYELFPILYDTKYMSYELQKKLKKGDGFDSNTLGTLYEYFKGKGGAIALYSPAVKVESGYYDNVDEQQVHEAGWDSFITGYCFVKMAHYFATTLNGRLKKLELADDKCMLCIKDKVQLRTFCWSHYSQNMGQLISNIPALTLFWQLYQTMAGLELLYQLVFVYGTFTMQFHKAQ